VDNPTTNSTCPEMSRAAGKLPIGKKEIRAGRASEHGDDTGRAKKGKSWDRVRELIIHDGGREPRRHPTNRDSGGWGGGGGGCWVFNSKN